jgi:hypothetical protein
VCVCVCVCVCVETIVILDIFFQAKKKVKELEESRNELKTKLTQMTSDMRPLQRTVFSLLFSHPSSLFSLSSFSSHRSMKFSKRFPRLKTKEKTMSNVQKASQVLSLSLSLFLFLSHYLIFSLPFSFSFFHSSCQI